MRDRSLSASATEIRSPRRRRVICALSALCALPSAWAQRPGKPYRIGFPSVVPRQAFGHLADALEQGLRDDRDAYLETQQRQQQLRVDLLASLEKLDLQESRLETVTKQLEALKTPRSLSVTVEELIAMGRAVQKQLDEKGEWTP